MLETTWQDVRHSWRALRRAPGFALAAVMTLALGIAATTVIFSVVDATLLRPLPYPDPERIFVLTTPDAGPQTGQMLYYVRERARAFEHVGAQRESPGWNLVAGARVEFVTGLEVTAGYFEAHGVRPLRGRTFTRAESEAGGQRVAILSEALWQRLFGARSDAVGSVIDLGGTPHTVIGVMPATFASIPAGTLWTALRTSPEANARNFRIVGRLRDGVTATQAAGELDTIKSSLATDVPGISAQQRQALLWMPYRDVVGFGQRNIMFLLFAAAACLALIASVNVASLQTARGVARAREFVTRLALGGTRTRLVRIILIECFILAAFGTLAGVLMAVAGVRALRVVLPAELVAGASVELNLSALLFAAAIAVASGVLSGLAPAVGAGRIRSYAMAGTAREAGSAGAPWLRRALTAVQMTLAVVLLLGATLFTRTLVNLASVDLGFNPSSTIVGEMAIQGSTASKEAVTLLVDRGLAGLRALPGVTAVAVSNAVPVDRAINLSIQPVRDGLLTSTRAVDWTYVSPDYFDAFGFSVRTGRVFDARDVDASPPVAVVNEAFARDVFGRNDVLGEFVQLTRNFDDPPRAIVGIVADVKGRSGAGWTQGLTALGTPTAPMIYVPLAQAPTPALALVHQFAPMYWTVRSSATPATVVRQLDEAMKTAAPHLPFRSFATMEGMIDRDVARHRSLAMLIGLFATLATVLAGVGLYGLIAYLVAQRRREVGVRMALGADSGRVLSLFLKEGLTLAAIGAVAGIALALSSSGAIAGLLFGVRPADPVMVATATGVLVLVAVCATILPALKAARMSPVQALRAE